MNKDQKVCVQMIALFATLFVVYIVGCILCKWLIGLMLSPVAGYCVYGIIESIKMFNYLKD